MKGPVGHLPRKAEQGSTLVMALLFVTMVGMLSLAFLNHSSTNSKASVKAKELHRRLAAVDGALTTAIQKVRKTPGACASGAAAAPGTAIASGVQVDGVTVDVSCRFAAATTTASSAANWAVFITSRNNGKISAEQAGEKKIAGAVYNAQAAAGWDIEAGTISIAGDLVMPPNCPAVITDVTVTPAPFGINCVAAGLPEPTATQTLPLYSAIPTAPAPTTVGTCRVFSPGRYTGTVPIPNQPSYFKSGVYAFNNAGTVTFGNGTYIGGKPRVVGTPGNLTVPGACSGVPDYANDPNNGVVFVLSGNSQIVLTNQSQVELWGWVNTADANAGPVPMSLRQALSTDVANGWPVSTNTGVLLNDANGNQHRLSIHGSVYMPAGGAQLRDTNQAFAQLQSGIVAASFEIDSSASASGTAFASAPQQAGAAQRYVLTATTTTNTTAKKLIGIADITLGADANRTPTINSWSIDNL